MNNGFNFSSEEACAHAIKFICCLCVFVSQFAPYNSDGCGDVELCCLNNRDECSKQSASVSNIKARATVMQ